MNHYVFGYMELFKFAATNETMPVFEGGRVAVTTGIKLIMPADVVDEFSGHVIAAAKAPTQFAANALRTVGIVKNDPNGEERPLVVRD